MEFLYQISISMNLFLVVFLGFSYSSQSHTFYVGGKDGWVANPSENYNHWAERNRFQVNDTLIFKYKSDLDSVLEVSRDDYYTCKKQNPLKTLKDGGSEFKFDRSGPFYFISGYSLNCEKGQKLLVIVMFPRTHRTAADKSPSPSLSLSPSPTPTPVAHPAKPPSSHSPSPSLSSPTPSQGKNPPPVSPPQPTQAPTPAPELSVQHHEHHLGPAPAPGRSAASATGGGLNVVSLLSSLTVTMIFMMMMMSYY